MRLGYSKAQIDHFGAEGSEVLSESIYRCSECSARNFRRPAQIAIMNLVSDTRESYQRVTTLATKILRWEHMKTLG